MTQVIFGAWQIAGAPSFKECKEKQAQAVLEYAYQNGITSFDTAPVYGMGKSEERIGKYLKPYRKDIQIITKFGFDWGEEKNTFIDLSPEGIEKQLNKSLERLQTDYVDIYLLHSPEQHTTPEDILETLNKLKKEGKIKSYGVCNMYGSQLQSFLEHPLSQIEYIEDFYNILEKQAERLIFPYIKKDHKFLAYSPLYRGLLTSMSMKQLLEKDEDGINMLLKNVSLPHFYKQKLLYEEISKRKGISLQELALGFLDTNTNVDSIIYGTSDTQHLDEFLNIIHGGDL